MRPWEWEKEAPRSSEGKCSSLNAMAAQLGSEVGREEEKEKKRRNAELKWGRGRRKRRKGYQIGVEFVGGRDDGNHLITSLINPS